MLQARTKDDALITVKTMIFFELRDIETMLNQTADPIADFIKWVRPCSMLYWLILSYIYHIHTYL